MHEPLYQRLLRRNGVNGTTDRCLAASVRLRTDLNLAKLGGVPESLADAALCVAKIEIACDLMRLIIGSELVDLEKVGELVRELQSFH
ncbi:hypothetical protein [Pandoraea fibrosis]|uniref:Uncharacterized protein n=1 Tax=Pandoraea fibrosis TaxID=1891094 RepID=A0A5E4XGJ5_9BURK|nr:hypothetical protein [Pandoraea fibrosis]VVE35494.1 hypothetical protein PFI31113_03840 [Pandoraea fibrosis]